MFLNWLGASFNKYLAWDRSSRQWLRWGLCFKGRYEFLSGGMTSREESHICRHASFLMWDRFRLWLLAHAEPGYSWVKFPSRALLSDNFFFPSLVEWVAFFKGFMNDSFLFLCISFEFLYSDWGHISGMDGLSFSSVLLRLFPVLSGNALLKNHLSPLVRTWTVFSL